jgi:hypothetical protein
MTPAGARPSAAAMTETLTTLWLRTLRLVEMRSP